MNVLVIMAVKTRPRLQSKYNILLASLAGTDLLVGAASHPIFIAVQIYVIKGLSLIEYCRYHKKIYLIFGIPVLASLFHLTLISIERFVAIKYTFRYVTIVTGLRLKIAVVGSWIIACLPLILQSFFCRCWNHNKGRSCLGQLVKPFVDTLLSFIGLFCNPPTRETNQMSTSFTTSRCRLCKGEESSENYQDDYNGFACLLCSLVSA